MKKSLCIAVAITLALSSMSVIIPMSDITVSATDPLPPRTHDGVYTVAAFPKEDDCPLVVQNARIIFDIEETPLTYDLSQDFSTYAGKVVTEYTLFNPTFETLKATLLLPFGMLPSYGWVYDENVQIAIDASETEKYKIFVDGESVETNIRYTLKFDEQFDATFDFSRLNDTYLEDGFFLPDTLVTKYTYKLASLEGNKRSAYINFHSLFNETQRRFMLWPAGSFDQDYSYNAGFTWAEEGAELELYVFGKELSTLPTWKLYNDRSFAAEVNGEVVLLATETMTYKDFVFVDYPRNNGISETDWYNAFLCNMQLRTNQWGFISAQAKFLGDEDAYAYYERFLRWFEYDVEIEPNTTVTNTIVAPLYPTVNEEYEPIIFEYTYQLSPLECWADFGSLNIQVNMPASRYLISAELGNFEKTENGYALSMPSLPIDIGYSEKQLSFEICSSEKPHATTQIRGCIVKSCTSSVIGEGGMLFFMASTMALIIKKRKNK